jgi:hypothetical protein
MPWFTWGGDGFTVKQGTARTCEVISDLDYADDIAMLEEAIDKATEQLQRLSDAAAEVGLEINTEKNEYMSIYIENVLDEQRTKSCTRSRQPTTSRKNSR